MCLFEYLPLFLLHVCSVSLTRFKEFKEFLPCYFTSPSVKVIDAFQKFWGIVDGHNEFHRQIASGVKKMADESMSAIQFHTAPEVDLPQYSHIFRKTHPLGVYIKNVACYGLVTMLYLEIQKGKEDMKIGDRRYCSLHKDTNDGYKRLWPTDVK